MTTAPATVKLDAKSLKEKLLYYAPSMAKSPDSWAESVSTSTKIGDIFVLFKPAAEGVHEKEKVELEFSGIAFVYTEDSSFPMSYLLDDQTFELSFMEGVLSSQASDAKDKDMAFYCIRTQLRDTLSKEVLADLAKLAKTFGGSGERKSEKNADPLYSFLNTLGIEVDSVLEKSPLPISDFALALWNPSSLSPNSKVPRKLSAHYDCVEAEIPTSLEPATKSIETEPSTKKSAAKTSDDSLVGKKSSSGPSPFDSAPDTSDPFADPAPKTAAGPSPFDAFSGTPDPFAISETSQVSNSGQMFDTKSDDSGKLFAVPETPKGKDPFEKEKSVSDIFAEPAAKIEVGPTAKSAAKKSQNPLDEELSIGDLFADSPSKSAAKESLASEKKEDTSVSQDSKPSPNSSGLFDEDLSIGDLFTDSKKRTNEPSDSKESMAISTSSEFDDLFPDEPQSKKKSEPAPEPAPEPTPEPAPVAPPKASDEPFADLIDEPFADLFMDEDERATSTAPKPESKSAPEPQSAPVSRPEPEPEPVSATAEPVSEPMPVPELVPESSPVAPVETVKEDESGIDDLFADEPRSKKKKSAPEPESAPASPNAEPAPEPVPASEQVPEPAPVAPVETVKEDDSGIDDLFADEPRSKKKKSAPEPEPVLEPVIEPEAAPISAPEPESAPVSPTAEPASEQLPEPVTEPVPEPVPEPVTEPVPEQVPLASVETVKEDDSGIDDLFADEPRSKKKKSAPEPEPVLEPVIEPEAAPISAPEPESAPVSPTAEPASEQLPEPAPVAPVETVKEDESGIDDLFADEPRSKKKKSAPEPEPVLEPVIEPEAAPVSAPEPESAPVSPAAESVSEPVPVPEPVSEPAPVAPVETVKEDESGIDDLFADERVSGPVPEPAPESSPVAPVETVKEDDSGIDDLFADEPRSKKKESAPATDSEPEPAVKSTQLPEPAIEPEPASSLAPLEESAPVSQTTRSRPEAAPETAVKENMDPNLTAGEGALTSMLLNKLGEMGYKVKLKPDEKPLDSEIKKQVVEPAALSEPNEEIHDEVLPVAASTDSQTPINESTATRVTGKKTMSVQATLQKLEDQKKAAYAKLDAFKEIHEAACNEGMANIQPFSHKHDQEVHEQFIEEKELVLSKLRQSCQEAKAKISSLLYEYRHKLESELNPAAEELEAIKDELQIGVAFSELRKDAEGFANKYANKVVNLLDRNIGQALAKITETELANIESWQNEKSEEQYRLFDQLQEQVKQYCAVAQEELDKLVDSMSGRLERLKTRDLENLALLETRMNEAFEAADKRQEMTISRLCSRILAEDIMPQLSTSRASLEKVSHTLSQSLADKLDSHSQDTLSQFDKLLTQNKECMEKTDAEVEDLRSTYDKDAKKQLETMLSSLSEHLENRHNEFKELFQRSETDNSPDDTPQKKVLKKVKQLRVSHLGTVSAMAERQTAESKNLAEDILRQWEHDSKAICNFSIKEFNNEIEAFELRRKEARQKIAEKLEALTQMAEEIAPEFT